MANDIDDDIEDMVTDFLLVGGESCTYSRGVLSSTMTLRRSGQRPVMIDFDGLFMEVRGVDFIGLTSALPYGEPIAGDRITLGGITYEVMPTTGEKNNRQLSTKMIRIHTKQVTG